MYNLTVSYRPTELTSMPVQRPGGLLGAAQALQGWFEAEATGYHVTCQDKAGDPVTKGQLRASSRQS